MKKKSLANRIIGSSMLAMLIEVSTDPKPLNVTKLKNIGLLKFENFLATISHLTIPFLYSFEDGYKESFRIGRRIFEATTCMLESQSAGNTSLGTILLMIPLITASSHVLSKNEEAGLHGIREGIRKVLDSSKVEDSIYICRAILATRPRWLLKVKEYDITREGWEEEVIKKNANPREIMREASNYDWIAYEYYNYFEITFEECYPLLSSFSKEEGLQKAILRTFLYMLSRRVDSHILRKYGPEFAERVRKFVEEKLKREEDLVAIAKQVDEEFKGVNAGTTADLIASGLFLLFLIEGSRKYI